MPIRRQIWAIACLALGTLLVRDGHAAPNIYSGHTGSASEARLTVTAPTPGRREAGDSILIAWKKKTDGKVVQIALHQASSSGGRGDKVRDVPPSADDKRGWTATGGSLKWKLPEDLAPGRYVIAIHSQDFVATSDVFSVTKPDNGPKLGPVKLGPDGIVTKADVSDRGATGHVLIKSSQGETRYDWGTGLCEKLEGGLPGALATMAALGNAEITPRMREVTEQNTVKQRCIVGLISKNKVVAPEG
jgi:hypothetical protein